MSIRYSLPRCLGAVLFSGLAACAQQSEPAAVSHAPQQGEHFFANLRQLTFDGQNAEAYFSADGTRLIFQRQIDPEGCDQEFTMNVDGTDMRRVSNGLGRTTCGYFYEDDHRILYSSTHNGGAACPPRPDMSRGYVWPLSDFDIYTALPDGSDLRNITNRPDSYDAEATLSSDGARIVFTSTRDGDIEIYTMNVDGSDVKRLTDAVGYDGGPFYSPDGSLIVYRAWHPEDEQSISDYQSLLADKMIRPSRMELWVMDADGSNQHQITTLGGANFAPFFHPDGTRIIFSSNHADPAGREFDLYMISVAGEDLVRVTTSGEFDGFPQFSPDGSKLVFASNRHGATEGDTNIFVADWVENEAH